MSQTNKKSNGFLPQTLDIDDSIIDNNLKIVENKDLEDKITGIFPGLVNNANASAAKHYKTDCKLLPTDEYPTVQVFYKICNEFHVKKKNVTSFSFYRIQNNIMNINYIIGHSNSWYVHQN